MVSDGSDIWERDFYDYATNHSETLLGFKPGRTNLIQVTVYDKNRNEYTDAQLLTFITAPLPSDFPTWTVLKSEPDEMEPGYTLFIIQADNQTNDYTTIMDNSGQVVWYRQITHNGDLDVRQLANGDLFFESSGTNNFFREVNMLGEAVQTWYPPAEYPVNFHESLVNETYNGTNGTIMYLSDVKQTVSDFPSNDTNADASSNTVLVDDNPVVEVSFTNNNPNTVLLNAWSPLTDGLIDPTRVTYLTYGEYSSSGGYGVDSEHANALIDDTNDNSIVVSMRNQNAIFKFSRSTDQLKWILGPHELWGTNWQQYLLTPVGTPFDWNYGQHCPRLTPDGTLLVYNDDNYQASPFDPPVPDQDNYSSAIEYNINETNMTVSEVWNSAWQTNQDRLYTPYVGKAQWLPQTRDVLVTYGAVKYVNGVPPSAYAPGATMVRLIEYTHDPVPQVVFDVSFFDYSNTSSNYSGDFCYRSTRIPDLYSHPAVPVTDLVVSDENETPLLEFSADPARSYLIQASTDLTNWTTIGTPIQEGDAGDFDFEDLNANQFTARFYRVVTQ